MRRPHAPRIQPDPQEWLDAHEFRETLSHIGMNLTVEDVKAVFNYVDSNRDMNLQVAELEKAMNRHRRMRTREWEAMQPKRQSQLLASTAPLPQSPTAQSPMAQQRQTMMYSTPDYDTRRSVRPSMAPDYQDSRVRARSPTVLSAVPKKEGYDADDPRMAFMNVAPQVRKSMAPPPQAVNRTTIKVPQTERRSSADDVIVGGLAQAFMEDDNANKRASRMPERKYEMIPARSLGASKSFGPNAPPPPNDPRMQVQEEVIQPMPAEPRASMAPAAMKVNRRTLMVPESQPKMRQSVSEHQLRRAETNPDMMTPAQSRATIRSARPPLRGEEDLPVLCRGADPGMVLDCINSVIDYKKARLSDFFRNLYYNPEYTGSEQELDTKGLHDIMLKTETNLDKPTLRNTMEAISPMGNDKITVGDLEQTLRARRSGRNPWLEEDFLIAQQAARRQRAKSMAPMDERMSVFHRLANNQRGEEEPESELAPKTKPPPKKLTAEDAMRAAERLYANAEEIARKKRQMREEWLVEDLENMDLVGQGTAKKGISKSDRHIQLHNDKVDRQERLEQHALAARALERMVLNVAPNKEVTSTPEERMKRVEDLHQHHQEKLKSREEAAKIADDQHHKNIELALERTKKVRADQKKACGVKDDAYSNIESKFQEPAKIRDTPAPEPPAKLNAPAIEAVDHALAHINNLVSLRCGQAPEDADTAILSEIVEPLKSALEIHRSALAVRGRKKSVVNEVRILESESSLSPWDGYHLRPDAEGCKNNRMPDVIHQLYDDVRELMSSAAVAQDMLLAMVAFADIEKSDKLSSRWPAGQMWRRPLASSRCAFAYNPGVKTMDRACRKAWVRYAPSADNHVVHLTDLVRVGLVFEDAQQLRGGLQDILEKFEVVDVRNYYHPSHHNLLGERFVEVLVTVSGAGLAHPIIAELRLEEMAYFEARRKTEEKIKYVCNAVGEMYSKACSGLDTGSIEYLTEWVLKRPKEPHGTTVFRRALRRHYGSAVTAWRSVFGTAPNASYQEFKEFCFATHDPEHCAEHWMSLDSTRAGYISLFDLDPDACILMGDIRMRILDFWGGDEDEATGQEIWDWLTKGTDLLTPGRITQHELRALLFPLDVSPYESDTLFHHLDGMGGNRASHPNHITVQDITWLLKLPFVVNLRAAGLGKPSNTEGNLEHFREIKRTARGRRVEPGALQGRHAIKGRARTASPTRAAAIEDVRFAPREIQRQASRALSPNILKMVKGHQKQALPGSPFFANDPDSTKVIEEAEAANAAVAEEARRASRKSVTAGARASKAEPRPSVAASAPSASGRESISGRKSVTVEDKPTVVAVAEVKKDKAEEEAEDAEEEVEDEEAEEEEVEEEEDEEEEAEEDEEVF
mmetsp:Transcript_47511/g.102384  ORF Transcript_47511/g.102384 Transcript_47511/m.102384 type:complete len:1377 (+) Transcript_47511:1-4131(+)